jgi:quinoprotein glucose dehydrogenase
LNNGEIVWQVPLGQDIDLEEKGITDTGSHVRGGIDTGGGLIFIAATSDKKIRAFDQKNGHMVWETDLSETGQAITSTYAIEGKQYVTIAVNPNPEMEFNGGYFTYALK